jgi:hypothetical protein
MVHPALSIISHLHWLLLDTIRKYTRQCVQMNIDTSPLPSRSTSGSDVVMSTTWQQQQQQEQLQQQQQRHSADGD